MWQVSGVKEQEGICRSCLGALILMGRKVDHLSWFMHNGKVAAVVQHRAYGMCSASQTNVPGVLFYNPSVDKSKHSCSLEQNLNNIAPANEPQFCQLET